MDENTFAALLGSTQCLIGIACSLLNILVIVACMMLAQKKNRSVALWGLAGFFFSLLALFILLLLPTVQRWPAAYPPPPVPYPPQPAPMPYAAPAPMPYAPAPAAYAPPPASYAPTSAPEPSYPPAGPTVIQGGWRLTVIHGPDAGQSFALSVQARLGRNADNEIRLNDPQASRYHALVQRQQNNYVIIDQGSGNGTYVNGELIHKPTPLATGDVITIGNTQIKVG